MRNRIVAAFFLLLAPSAFAKSPHSAIIAQLPNGMLAGHVYINEAVGVTFSYPSDWSVSTDPKETSILDPDHPDGPAVQCSRVLLWLRAPSQAEGRFSSRAALIAIDPKCMTLIRFPQSERDRAAINDVVSVIIKWFKNAPFFSPYGVDVLATHLDGRTVVLLKGGMIINAVLGHPAPTKEPLEVQTSFSITEVKGLWIAWAWVADAPSVETLKKGGIHFADHLPEIEQGVGTSGR